MHVDTFWNVAEALQTYYVDQWGKGYFGVNEKGHFTVYPQWNHGQEVDMLEVVEAAKAKGLSFPILLRFQDLLRHRVQRLNEAFRQAIKEEGYQGNYQGVFPLKVNHLKEVVEEILEGGKPYHFGLEVGSKPELFAALSRTWDPQNLIICNGYKDSMYIEAALLGYQLGKKVIMVVEKLEELSQIITLSEKLNIRPPIGVRLRLKAKSAGHWALSGGDNAKFGLSTSDLMAATELLKEKGWEDQLHLVHFHMGSQIPDIQIVINAVREATRYFAKLRQMGFGVKYLDVGGGLGVDYDGSRAANDSSINYTLEEYTRDIVYNVMDVCNEEKVSHPHLISESGRAIVAHHSVLIVNALDTIGKTSRRMDFSQMKPSHRLVEDLLEIRRVVTAQNRRECFHDAVQVNDTAHAHFDLGLLDLQSKAQVETLFWEIAQQVVSLYGPEELLPDEIREILPSLGVQFLCNFSIFQSMVDHWALNQLFPIVPIHRLNESPRHSATLVDITCDSDGKISQFINGNESLRETLPLHSLDGRPYYLGIFLMGAYQDIMGDLHNLFGAVNEAHVFLSQEKKEGFFIKKTLHGSTIKEVLADVQYEEEFLVTSLKNQIDKAVESQKMKPEEGQKWLHFYEQGLNASTYLKVS